jgi:hypothetical protein
MNVEVIERTPAEARKVTADQQLKKLLMERETLQTRKQESGPHVARLQDEIDEAERAGADPQILATLRRDRTEAEQVGADLERVISNIDAELVPTQAELRAATVACHAEKYNELVEKQRALATVIDEAIHTIVETLHAKEALACTQDRMQGDAGCPNPELFPAQIRVALQRALAHHLIDGAVSQKLQSFSRIDWSCRSMHPGGHLE